MVLIFEKLAPVMGFSCESLHRLWVTISGHALMICLFCFASYHMALK